jgi:hypothetical protein
MSEEMAGRWAVVRPTLSPKLGAGQVDLYWEGPDGRWGCWDAFGPRGDALTFASEGAALEAIIMAFGPEWWHHRSLQGARVVELRGPG